MVLFRLNINSCRQSFLFRQLLPALESVLVCLV